MGNLNYSSPSVQLNRCFGRDKVLAVSPVPRLYLAFVAAWHANNANKGCGDEIANIFSDIGSFLFNLAGMSTSPNVSQARSSALSLRLNDFNSPNPDLIQEVMKIVLTQPLFYPPDDPEVLQLYAYFLISIAATTLGEQEALTDFLQGTAIDGRHLKDTIVKEFINKRSAILISDLARHTTTCGHCAEFFLLALHGIYGMLKEGQESNRDAFQILLNLTDSSSMSIEKASEYMDLEREVVINPNTKRTQLKLAHQSNLYHWFMLRSLNPERFEEDYWTKVDLAQVYYDYGDIPGDRIWTNEQIAMSYKLSTYYDFSR